MSAIISNHIRSLELYLWRSGARVVRCNLPGFVNGRSRRDLITLRKDLEPREELSTLVHELTHWLAHRETGESCVHYTVFEYEAEAVEALVMKYLGTQCSGSAAPALENESPTDDLLLSSVERVNATSRRIFDVLECGQDV
jgi:hypothetical protein